MPDLLSVIVSERTLRDAWEKVRDNRGAPGADGETIESFAVDADRHITQLREKLLDGTYRWSRLRRVTIPKKSGGLRELNIPGVRDRIVQTAIALVLTPILEPEMEEESYAYRAGRSVKMAVEKVSGYYTEGFRWIVDADIDDYFDTVPHELLRGTLARHIDDPPLLDFIFSWLGSCFPHGRGLPQGSPLSPLLANIYLDALDEGLKERGAVRLVRFADDFLLLCRKREAAEESLPAIAALLTDLGLRLHPEKTRIVSFDQGFSYLGHLFVRSIAVKQEAEEAHPWEEEPQHQIMDRHPVVSAEPTQSRGEMAVSGETAESAEEEEETLPEPADEAIAGAERESGQPELSARMRVLYVSGVGRLLTARNRGFSVRAGAEADAAELLALQPERIDRIEIWPGAGVSAAAEKLALAQGVEIAWVSGHGRTRGTLSPPFSRRAALHLAQARFALDSSARVELARRIVGGRLHNQRALLSRLNRKRRDATAIGAQQTIKRILKHLGGAYSVLQLMGHEGEGARAYWAGLAPMLDPAWGFTGRNRRPPRDPINAIISLSAWLLHRDLRHLAVRHGLHPGFGALHSAVDGRDGCASDLIEEFRAPLCEGLAVYLANNNIIRPELFISGAEDGCIMLPEGRERIIRAREAWLDRVLTSPASGRQVKWRGLMEEQVLRYRDHILGAGEYLPYKMDY